ncbi:hypothetical protein C0Q70_06231 [Pomacea canaliculata]|uniref:Uncharacterized protein n=1 Tax=Pomacea canaliculata TaxID=400727 RepID=A0A2T7PNF0_POMCA|nr:hypothetical protein C0Q70_06231 [Pomacea canaliculata]
MQHQVINVPEIELSTYGGCSRTTAKVPGRRLPWIIRGLILELTSGSDISEVESEECDIGVFNDVDDDRSSVTPPST